VNQIAEADAKLLTYEQCINATSKYAYATLRNSTMICATLQPAPNHICFVRPVFLNLLPTTSCLLFLCASRQSPPDGHNEEFLGRGPKMGLRFRTELQWGSGSTRSQRHVIISCNTVLYPKLKAHRLSQFHTVQLYFENTPATMRVGWGMQLSHLGYPIATRSELLAV